MQRHRLRFLPYQRQKIRRQRMHIYLFANPIFLDLFNLFGQWIIQNIWVSELYEESFLNNFNALLFNTKVKSSQFSETNPIVNFFSFRCIKITLGFVFLIHCLMFQVYWCSKLCSIRQLIKFGSLILLRSFGVIFMN